MDCIRQNHTYKLEHTMFMIAIQEQHLIIRYFSSLPVFHYVQQGRSLR
jgi:hypothetical protein